MNEWLRRQRETICICRRHFKFSLSISLLFHRPKCISAGLEQTRADSLLVVVRRARTVAALATMEPQLTFFLSSLVTGQHPNILLLAGRKPENVRCAFPIKRFRVRSQPSKQNGMGSRADLEAMASRSHKHNGEWPLILLCQPISSRAWSHRRPRRGLLAFECQMTERARIDFPYYVSKWKPLFLKLGRWISRPRLAL